MDIKKIFGQNVKKYRKSLGYTQMQLAEFLNVDQKHISFIESGNSFPSSTLISKISEKLKVSPDKLFLSAPIPSIEVIKQALASIIDESSDEVIEKIYNYANYIKLSEK